MVALLKGFRHLGAGRDLVRLHNSPQCAGRISQRTLISGVEAVAVGGYDCSILKHIAGSELQLGLHKLLQLPLVGSLIPTHPPKPPGAPVTSQIGAVEASVVGNTKSDDRATKARSHRDT
jgi:hypothetical protein